MHRVMKPDGIAVIIIMNLKALAKDPNGYYPNKLSSKQLDKKLKEHNFKSIKNQNLKAFIWSTYFDKTSVYSYSIVKPIKSSISQKNLQSSKNPSGYANIPFRQKARIKVLKKPILYKFTKNLYRKYCSITSWLHTTPDFLIIGAAKCGTSSLYDYLMQHPCVGKSLTKQIHFFDRYPDRGLSWYKVCFPFKWQKFYVEKILRKHFSTGESTPHYMTHPLAAKRAYDMLPNAKIIVMLRNPIDRAYSHYQMLFDYKQEVLSFEEAIEIEKERIAGEYEKMLQNVDNTGKNFPHRAYLTSGKYAKQIEEWQKYYPKEQFFIIKSEDFNNNPSKIYNQVLKFLELPPHDLKIYEKIRKRNYQKMNPDTRKKLVDYFKPLNQRLYKLLEMEFDWDK